MTFPDLPPLYPGLIWDGVTQYEEPPNDTQPSTGIVVISTDGSREIVKEWTHRNPMWKLNSLWSLGERNLCITFENPDEKLGWYFDYNGDVVQDPVNQVPYLQKYREHASRFAHELNFGMGFKTSQDASARDRETTWDLFTASIGHVWHKYEDWESLDPEELIVGGVYDATLLWKRSLEDMAGYDAALCGQCDVSMYASRFMIKADLPSFRIYYNSGIIPTINRDTTPWSPHGVLAAAQTYGLPTQAAIDAALLEFFTGNEEYYHKALEYYANIVGARDSHTHE